MRSRRPFQEKSVALFIVVSGLIVFAGCTPRPVSPPPSETVKVENPLNLNTASEKQLRDLPYIGEKLAAEIIEFRAQHGNFHRPEQLLLLKGISEKRFRELRPYVTTE